MASGTSVNLFDPLDPGASAVAAQQIARSQGLADALRARSLAAIPYDPKGAISPWQGLAQAGSGLAAAFAQRSVDKRTTDMANSRAQALGNFVSANSGAPPQSGLSAAFNGPAAPPPMPAPAPAAPPSPPVVPGGQPGFVDNMQAAIAPPQDAPPPPAAPMPAPQPDAPPPPVNWVTGTQQGDQLLAQTDFGGYMKQLALNHAPTDAMKQAAAAYGIGTPAFKAAMQAQATKAGFIEPTNIREGGAAIFNDGSGRIMTAPKTEVGMQNIRDPQGNVIGQGNVPGALDAIAESEAARSAGKARGALPYETVPTYNNATGQTVLTPKSATLAGGFPTTAPLGAPQFANTQAEAGGKFFSGLADSAADSPNRIYALNQMSGLLGKGTAFGPGTDTAIHFADFLNGVGKAVGYQGSFNDANVTNVNEFNKFAAQYSARAAADLGLSGSDKRLDMSIAATPNGHMTTQALQSVIPQMVGFEAAKQGMANAGAAYAQSHPGPNAQGQFLAQWRASYDPNVYQITSLPKPQQAAAIAKLSPDQRATLAKKWQALKAMGAIQ